MLILLTITDTANAAQNHTEKGKSLKHIVVVKGEARGLWLHEETLEAGLKDQPVKVGIVA